MGNSSSPNKTDNQVAMAITLISLMVILASSVESYRKPFTAFNKYQVDLVHGNRYAGSRAIQPVVHKTVSYPRYTQPSSQNFFSSQRFGGNSFNFGRRNFVRGRIPSNRFTSGNIVQNAKAQAESTLEILKSFEGSSIASQYIDPIFETSKCLNNLEDVTKLIEDGTKLIVENGPEIIYLEAIVDNLKGETDVIKLTKGSAKMLRTLDGLGPALAAGASNLCISSPESSVEGFEDLARALRSISNSRDLIVPQSSRQLLEISAEIMDQTAEFLEAQLKALETFKTVCENESNNQRAIYDSTVDIMDSLAKLFEAMGFEDKAAEINKQSGFIKKFVDAYAGLDDLDLDLECSLVGDYNALAQTLDDLAVIIESVGVEELSKELGLNLDFNSV